MSTIAVRASAHESSTSPGIGSGGFTAVNGHSSNGNHVDSSVPSVFDESLASDVSSQNSTPLLGSRNGHSSHSPPSTHSTYQEREHKRKRSGEEEMEYQPHSRQYDFSPPKRLEHPRDLADKALHALAGREAYGGPGWTRETQPGPVGHANGLRSNTSEAHVAELLQREQQAQDSQPRPWDLEVSPEGQDSYSPDGQMNGSLHSGPKRKRNFSNRTKTGCMTCRRRKKKCDELHPICNNCIRGGFPCQGYSVARSTWTKTPTSSGPVPLQSRNGGSTSSPDESRYRADNPSYNPKRPLPPLPRDGGSMHPVPGDGHDNTPITQHSTSPAQEPRSRPPYATSAWPPQQNQQQPYQQDHLPPLSDSHRPDSSSGHPPPRPAPSARDMSRPPSHNPPHPSATAMPPPQGNPHPSHGPPPQQHPHAPPPSASQQQSTGPMSQGHPPGGWAPPHAPPPQPEYRQSYAPPPPQPPPPPRAEPHPTHQRVGSSSYEYVKSGGARTFTVEEVERSRMLRLTRYNHLDPTLENDRSRCERALARFNNASRTFDSGISEEEARNVFLRVIDPSRDTGHLFLAPVREKGLLAHGVKIEAPFTCTYGYNLKIMDNVFIGKGTSMDDAAKIEIGPRTYIGPRVTIMTNDVCKDMVDRKGVGGSWIASPVIIASEVVIGEGAVIYPGVRLERGCTIEPFAIVRESVQENVTLRAASGPRVG